uniref:Uncharacterized protein n=1 Tax=Otus sunia TaxID=257818 RepID=A0A8C8ASG0_9STRI
MFYKQLLKLFVHSSNPSVKLYSTDSIPSFQKNQIYLLAHPPLHLMCRCCSSCPALFSQVLCFLLQHY